MIVKNGSLFFGEWLMEKGMNTHASITFKTTSGVSHNSDTHYDDVRQGRIVPVDDTTPVSFDEYTHVQVPGTSTSSTRLSYTDVGNLIYSADVTNVSSQPVVISGICLDIVIDDYYETPDTIILVARTVLETPQTLQPNETVTLNYQIRFN